VDRLRNIVEPEALLLTWQPPEEALADRTRRVVARIEPDHTGQLTFEYLRGADDFLKAREAGFQGFPLISMQSERVSEGVLEALMRRLPPRRRDDFDKYLDQHRLPSPFAFSDLALLGHTGARLPSDGFSLVPVFPSAHTGPCDFIVEVAGLRHVFTGDVSSIRLGDAVSIRAEPDNAIDARAVAIVWQGKPIGYVSRVLQGPFTDWLLSRQSTAQVTRVNGKPSRPLVYVAIRISATGLPGRRQP
jgi:hypothetical protein